MKYNVTYSCGHEGTVELAGKIADRERKLDWYASSGLCPECYKSNREAAEAAQPITIHISATPQINQNGQPLFCIWLSGNTRPAKDEIKSCGFRWSERWNDILGAKVTFCWCKKVVAEDIKATVQEIKALGAVVDNSSDSTNTIFAHMAADAAAAFEKKKAQIAAIEKPVKPEFLSGRWNGKVYGKKGNYSIYLDGNKKELTDIEAEEAKTYQLAKAEYDKKVAEIK